ncbi:MAG: hypothetical protein HON94_11925 [Methylococcales bacterium]|jgi:micrococcal nuclease|nr:hypothetical protein [Methylococcales bacterium]MBT7409476.1 hypothetical protein [Methylococcales bacterium]
MVQKQHKPAGCIKKIKKALFYSAFCFLWLNIFNVCYASCTARYFDEEVKIKTVIDGDTIRTDKNQSIRFIGINTPEINHKGGRSDPYSQKARKALVNLLKKYNNRVQLIYGQEKKDRYHRLLAHVFVNHSINVSADLLKQGLAIQISIPPNLRFNSCYRHLEKQAKSANLNLWRTKRFQVFKTSDLKKSLKGFYLVEGKVKKVIKNNRAIWITLNNNFIIKIKNKYFHYFDQQELLTLKGQIIQAKGWIYHRNNKSRMNIKHPDAIKYKKL